MSEKLTINDAMECICVQLLDLHKCYRTGDAWIDDDGNAIFDVGVDPYTWKFFGACLEAMRKLGWVMEIEFAHNWARVDVDKGTNEETVDTRVMSTFPEPIPVVGFRAVCAALGIEVVE